MLKGKQSTTFVISTLQSLKGNMFNLKLILFICFCCYAHASPLIRTSPIHTTQQNFYRMFTEILLLLKLICNLGQYIWCQKVRLSKTLFLTKC